MIRYSLLILAIGGLLALCYKRWFWALCGLVFLTVLAQHPSMPTNIAGIQGLNPWNLVFLSVLASWAVNRKYDPPGARAPDSFLWLLMAYVVMVVTAGVSAAVEMAGVATNENVSWIIVDGIVNPLKYLAVALLFYDGVRTRERVFAALFAAVGSCFVYGALFFKSINVRVFAIDFQDARRLTDKLIGLYANDMGAVLVFAFWAGLFLLPLLRSGWPRRAWLTTTLIMLPPFVALKSRAAFLALAVVGLFLGIFVRRRVLLFLLPAGVVLAFIAPSIEQRLTTGISSNESVNWDEVSAGRLTHLWPPVIRQISNSPIIGHGRYAILREDCREEILRSEGVLPTHPHNAYLEILLDAGIVGLSVVMATLAVITACSWRLMTAKDALASTVGVVGLIAVVTQMTVSVAGSSFFPSQSSVPYLVVWGTTLRLYVTQSAQVRRATNSLRAQYAFTRAAVT